MLVLTDKKAWLTIAFLIVFLTWARLGMGQQPEAEGPAQPPGTGQQSLAMVHPG